MIIPDYKGGSIVNLMSSITFARGYKSKYDQLKLLKSKNLSKSKNVVLIIIDGLGYDFFVKHSKSKLLKKSLLGKITSVFPSTTAAAISTYRTGLPPAEHGIVGWFQYFKAIGKVCVPLRFCVRGSEKRVNYNFLAGINPIFRFLKTDSMVLLPKLITKSKYTKELIGPAKVFPYSTVNGFFKQIKRLINLTNKKKYIYAYWPEFDSLCHEYGKNDKLSLKYYEALENKIELFLKSIKGTNTTVLITADHGQMQTSKQKMLKLNKYPDIKKTLSQPLSGEPRTVYCYVKNGKDKEFITAVNKNLKNKCQIFKSEDLIKKNFFGLDNINPKLKNRIGDYTLIMNDNYILKDFVKGEKRRFHLGNHGGVSSEETYVPLIYFNSK
jgi:predicted AlkP superfamily pyrophosphatase or phosphodiesterase